MPQSLLNLGDFFLTIIIVYMRLMGKWFDKSLLCATISGHVPVYMLSETVYKQTALKNEEGVLWGNTSVRLNKSGRFSKIPFELTLCQPYTIHHTSGLKLKF